MKGWPIAILPIVAEPNFDLPVSRASSFHSEETVHSDFLYRGYHQYPAKGQTHNTDSEAKHKHKQGPLHPSTFATWRNLRVLPPQEESIENYIFRGMLNHCADTISSLKGVCLGVIPFYPDKIAANGMEEGFYPHFTEKESKSLCDLVRRLSPNHPKFSSVSMSH